MSSDGNNMDSATSIFLGAGSGVASSSVDTTVSTSSLLPNDAPTKAIIVNGTEEEKLPDANIIPSSVESTSTSPPPVPITEEVVDANLAEDEKLSERNVATASVDIAAPPVEPILNAKVDEHTDEEKPASEESTTVSAVTIPPTIVTNTTSVEEEKLPEADTTSTPIAASTTPTSTPSARTSVIVTGPADEEKVREPEATSTPVIESNPISTPRTSVIVEDDKVADEEEVLDTATIRGSLVAPIAALDLPASSSSYVVLDSTLDVEEDPLKSSSILSSRTSFITAQSTNDDGGDDTARVEENVQGTDVIETSSAEAIAAPSFAVMTTEDVVEDEKQHDTTRSSAEATATSSLSVSEAKITAHPSYISNVDSTITLQEIPPTKEEHSVFSAEDVEKKKIPRDFRFWGVFVALAVSSFTSAMDLTGVSTALPVIAHDLHGTDFVWVAAAYAMSSTAFLPMSGGLAQVFGRRVVMLAAIILFLVGSILCGVAPNMNFLIAARTVQGLGGGGITALTQIIVSDMVSLDERGTFQGLVVLAWAIASFIGPVIGGALAQNGVWRWLFYLNIFTSVISGVLVFLFLNLKVPEGTIREKLKRMDWIGNLLVIMASCSSIIALSWGGVKYPWSSVRVLVPLLVGFAGLGLFILYEAKVARYPIVPFKILSNMTSLSGYVQTFFSAIVLIAVVYYLPIYFQACKGLSPVQSGVDIFGVAFLLAPTNVVTGILINKTQRYRPQLWVGWSLMMVGCGLLSMVKDDSHKALSIVYSGIIGISLGIVMSGTYYPVLSPLPVTENAHALAFFIFVRNFGQVWGVTIGSTALQNYLTNNLPASFLSDFPQGSEIAFSVIPILGQLPPEIAAQTRAAFAGGLAILWKVLIGVAAAGLLSGGIMKHVPLHTKTDESWGIENQDEKKMSDANEKV